MKKDGRQNLQTTPQVTLFYCIFISLIKYLFWFPPIYCLNHLSLCFEWLISQHACIRVSIVCFGLYACIRVGIACFVLFVTHMSASLLTTRSWCFWVHTWEKQNKSAPLFLLLLSSPFLHPMKACWMILSIHLN